MHLSASILSTRIDNVLFSTLADMHSYRHRDAGTISGRHTRNEAVYLESRFDMILPSIISRLHVARDRARAIDARCSVVCGVIDSSNDYDRRDDRLSKREMRESTREHHRLPMLGTVERVMMLLSMRSVDDVVIVHDRVAGSRVGSYTIVDRIDVHEDAGIADVALRVGLNRENYVLRNKKKAAQSASPPLT